MKTVLICSLAFSLCLCSFGAKAQIDIPPQENQTSMRANQHLWFTEVGTTLVPTTDNTGLSMYFALGRAYDVLPWAQFGGGFMIRNESLPQGSASSLPIFTQFQLDAAPKKLVSLGLRFRFGYVPIINQPGSYPLISLDLGLRTIGKSYKSGALLGVRFDYRNSGIYERNYLGFFLQIDFYKQKNF